MNIKRRQFTKEFKRQVLREIDAGKSIVRAAREYQVHPNTITKWRQHYRRYADRAFAGNGNAYTDEAKGAEQERLIGQLTIENAFLKKVLSKLASRERQ